MQPSIFTKIINGEIPSHKIYEDEQVYAFLDINPITPGHTLVIPKQPVEFVWDMNDEDYQAVMRAAKKIASSHRQRLAVPYIGQQIVGVDVPHAHVHLIPFTTVEEYRRVPSLSAEPDHAGLAAMAKKLSLA